MDTSQLDTSWARTWFEHAAQIVSAYRAELTDLDRAIGDGDHGENMDRGFSAAAAALRDTSLQTPGDVWALVARAAMMHIGGAAGPLLAMALTSVSSRLAEQPVATIPSLAQAITAGSDALTRLGKVQVGDKTMYDTWVAAAEVLQVSAVDASTAHALKTMALASCKAAANTKRMIARRGRASYLGERSRGTVDPGALSSTYILASAYTAYVNCDPQHWWKELHSVLLSEKEK